MKTFIKTIITLLIIIIHVCASGNLNDIELGTAIYRQLNTGYDIIEDHWHSAVFNYFEYINGTGYMRYTEAKGPGDPIENLFVSKSINISSYATDLIDLKSKFFAKFRHDNEFNYNGAYSRVFLPATRSSIVSTARQLGYEGISYTWINMLDCYGDWNDWNGSVSDISDIRCDGIVEYSYEKK